MFRMAILHKCLHRSTLHKGCSIFRECCEGPGYNMQIDQRHCVHWTLWVSSWRWTDDRTRQVLFVCYGFALKSRRNWTCTHSSWKLPRSDECTELLWLCKKKARSRFFFTFVKPPQLSGKLISINFPFNCNSIHSSWLASLHFRFLFFFAIESKSYLYLNDDANISHITSFVIDIQLMIVLVSYCTCCSVHSSVVTTRKRHQ